MSNQNMVVTCLVIMMTGTACELCSFQIINDHTAGCDRQASDCLDCHSMCDHWLAGADGDKPEVFDLILPAWRPAVHGFEKRI